jgi:hypothetical protein
MKLKWTISSQFADRSVRRTDYGSRNCGRNSRPVSERTAVFEGSTWL